MGDTKIKKYQDREWLYEHYIVRGESIRAMAKEIKCRRTTISKQLHKFNISRPQPIYKNKDWLYRHYIIKKETIYDMAEKANCGHATIWRWLYRLSIPVRDVGMAQFLARGNNAILLPRTKEFLIGELLGDGNLWQASPYSVVYQHSSKYKNYLVWLSGKLAESGIEQSGKIYKEVCSKQYKGIVYRYHSRRYSALSELRKLFYPNGIKIVPRNLELTPLIIRQWYIGDGSLLHPKSGNPYIYFATNAFDKTSIDHLMGDLTKRGIKTTYWPSNNCIKVSAYSTRDFLDYIGPCPKEIEPLYGYKWDLKYLKREWLELQGKGGLA